MTSSTSPIDKQERLSLLTKLAYGVGEMAPSMSGNIRAFFLLFFFTNVAGMSGTTAAIANSHRLQQPTICIINGNLSLFLASSQCDGNSFAILRG